MYSGGIYTIPNRPSPFVFKRSALTLNQNTNLHSVSTGEILSESCSLKPKAIPPDLFLDLVFRFFSLKTYPGISI